jgi:hypothetical protein
MDAPDDAAVWLLAHVLKGDACDGISPAFSGCGPKTALKLARNPAELEARLLHGPTRARFERNKTLIDLSNIPLDLVALAVEELRSNGCCARAMVASSETE